MRWFGRTLFAQVAALFVILLLIFCTIVVVLTARQFDAFLDEMGQRLNRELAADLAARLAPELQAGLHSDAAERAVQRVRDINPSLDIYVLDSTGRVARAFTDKPPSPDLQVDLAPIQAFLAPDAMLPIRAQDPILPDETKVFSAARIAVDDARDAYLYIILHGRPLDTAAGMLRNSYIVRGVLFGLGLLLLSIITVGLVLFALLTRRFRRLTEAVQGISKGDYGRRIPISSSDEIGRLGHAVNDMAGMIEAQVDALSRTDEARRELVANLSHDFRTPLTSLRGYADRLETGWDRLDTPAREECLQAVISNTEQLEQLATQLATLSLLDGHGQTAHMEAFSLNELTQDVILKFRPLAERQQVLLEGLYPELPDVWGDIGLIERVLSNLIDNAVNNTPAGGRVTVLSEATGSSVRLMVRDTGHGIAENELSLVTRRFYRTGGGRQLKPGGSGLGLAIAREILELHDSVLAVHSTVDVGSEFSFTLNEG